MVGPDPVLIDRTCGNFLREKRFFIHKRRFKPLKFKRMRIAFYMSMSAPNGDHFRMELTARY